ncbi:MAG TPA: hypothetical protein VNK43_03040, partial [Gemmatimonadales bacterium]|nr:hypothetical protein [Gemmatimonadales bacterium]
LLPPFLERVRSRLAVAARLDRATEDHVALLLAVRAAEVRWPGDADEELALRHDPDVAAALEHFPRLAQLLARQ